jgi:PAS domain-containing protein
MAETLETPALLVVERCPVPTIATAENGGVLFANTAFAEILGCSRFVVTSMSYEDVSSALPTGETLFAVARLRADNANLLHLGESMFFAKMSKSALMRGEDAVAIATFQQLMARLPGVAEP